MLAFGRCCLAAVLILLPDLVRAEQHAVPQVRMAQSDPGVTARLGGGEPLYLRLVYASDVPLRFRVEGYAGEAQALDGAMYNPAPPYPAGEGEALVWIAYRTPATIDALKVTVLDENWQPLTVLDAPANLQWSEAPPRAASARPDWVRRLNGAQQAAVSQTFEAGQEGEAASGVWLLDGLWFCVLGYVVLQGLAMSRLAGRWRLAASVPLIVAVPLFVYTIVALIAGSNLWPLAVLLLAPFGLAYLLAVWGARLVMRAGAVG